MNRWTTHKLSLGALGLFLATAATAQEPVVFDEEIDVELVELEVVVTGADGVPVTGLGRDDFELWQGRKRLDVSYFTAYENGRPAGAGGDAEGDGATAKPVAPAPTAGDRLHLVIYLDFAFLEPGELGDVVAALRDFLLHDLQPRDRVLLVTANDSLEVVHPFTTIPELIVDRLRRIEPPPPRGRTMTDFPRLLQEIERTAQRGGDPSALKAEIDSFLAEVHHELLVTRDQLHFLIPALAGLPGRKEILYVGGALPTNAGQRLYNAWGTAFGTNSAIQSPRRNAIPPERAGRFENTVPQAAAAAAGPGDLFRQVADHANAKGVTLHALDTGGLRMSDAYITSSGMVATERGGGGAAGTGVDASRRLGDPQTLRNLAERTGGRALIHSRDFDAALDHVASDLRTYYSLAFEPQDGGELRQIRVTVRGEKGRLALRYRKSYRSRDRDRIAGDQTVSALILGQGGGAPGCGAPGDNPLGISIAADRPQPAADDADSVKLPIYVIFPVSKLVWVVDPRGHRAQVSMYLTAGDFEHGATQVHKTVVPLVFSDEQMQDARERNIEYKLELSMPAGSRKVAVTLRDDLRPLSSTAVLEMAATSR